MMNRTGRRAVVSLFIVAVALMASVGSAGAQGTVITLADGVVVPGGGVGFVDLDPVNVDGFQQVALLGFTTPDPFDVIIRVAFATEPGDTALRLLAASCDLAADVGVHNCPGSGVVSFRVAGQFLTVRLQTSNGAASARTVTLKAYLR